MASSRNSERQNAILKALERKPLDAKEISDACELPLPTVYRRLQALLNSGHVEKTHGAYSLTSKGRQLLEVM